MDLESITDQEFSDLGQQHRAEILTEHCAAIESRIQSARSRKDAEGIAARACDGLKEACVSGMVHRALLRRTRAIVMQYWGAASTTKTE